MPPNASVGDCRWHIVEQGWKVHGGPGKIAVRVVGSRQDKYNLFRKGAKNWLYCFQDVPGGAESKNEYYVSKQLLFSYLASSEVLDACDGQIDIVKQVSKVIPEYVCVAPDTFVDSLANIIWSLQYSSSLTGHCYNIVLYDTVFLFFNFFCHILMSKLQVPMKAPTLDSRNMPLQSS